MSDYLKRELKITVAQIGNNDTGRELLINSLTSLLQAGTASNFFHPLRKHPFSKIFLNIICIGFDTEEAHNYSSR